ncbi:hypothetical protein HDV06_000331 [Boothiomyces sp. JEL0866]|nr:hypothetical protein HDV06_000331 [Boothiomyces sp. JEL0866]
MTTDNFDFNPEQNIQRDPQFQGTDEQFQGPRNKKTKGKQKIDIEYIQMKQRRQITFYKRKSGLIKKSHELHTLTGSEVLLLMVSETGHIYTYATDKLQPMISQPDSQAFIQSCLQQESAPLAENQFGQPPSDPSIFSGEAPSMTFDPTTIFGNSGESERGLKDEPYIPTSLPQRDDFSLPFARRESKQNVRKDMVRPHAHIMKISDPPLQHDMSSSTLRNTSNYLVPKTSNYLGKVARSFNNTVNYSTSASFGGRNQNVNQTARVEEKEKVQEILRKMDDQYYYKDGKNPYNY